MTIYDYLDQYGIYSFDEEPFNEVDSVLLSFLSYVDFGNIVERSRILLKDVGRMHLGLHHKDERNIIAVREATKLLNYMKDTKRYQDCYLYRYVYEANNNIQFCALSIEYKRNHVFVSYEGTDQMISGWKENFLLSYSFPTESHRKAVEYLNKNFTFGIQKLIVGGHSKGGNLALAAAMGCNPIVRHKIQTIYNVDGPGLLDKQFRSRKFKRLLPKYKHIIPQESVVGIILHNTNDIVIHSTDIGVMEHNIAGWEVNQTTFKRDKLCNFSKELSKGLLGIIDSYSDEELKSAIMNVDKICQKANVVSLLDFKEDYRKIISFIKACSCLDAESKHLIYDILNVVIRSVGNSRHQDFRAFVKRFKLDI